MGHGCSQARRVQDGPTGSRWRLRAHREGTGAVPGAVWHCVVGSEVGCRALPAPQLLPERPPGLSRDPCCCPRPVSLCPLRGGQLAPQRFPHGARGVSPVSASRPGWRSAHCPLNPRPHPSAPVGLTGLRGRPCNRVASGPPGCHVSRASPGGGGARPLEQGVSRERPACLGTGRTRAWPPAHPLTLRPQAWTSSPPSTAACTAAACPSPCGLRTPRTSPPHSPPSG